MLLSISHYILTHTNSTHNMYTLYNVWVWYNTVLLYTMYGWDTYTAVLLSVLSCVVQSAHSTTQHTGVRSWQWPGGHIAMQSPQKWHFCLLDTETDHVLRMHTVRVSHTHTQDCTAHVTVLRTCEPHAHTRLYSTRETVQHMWMSHIHVPAIEATLAYDRETDATWGPHFTSSTSSPPMYQERRKQQVFIDCSTKSADKPAGLLSWAYKRDSIGSTHTHWTACAGTTCTLNS